MLRALLNKYGLKTVGTINIGLTTNFLYDWIKSRANPIINQPQDPLILAENKVLTDQISELKTDKNLLNGQLVDSNSTNQILSDQNSALKELVSNLRDENSNLTQLVENSFEYKFESIITDYKVFADNFLSEIPSRFTDLTMSPATANIQINPYIWDAICQFFGLS